MIFPTWINCMQYLSLYLFRTVDNGLCCIIYLYLFILESAFVWVLKDMLKLRSNHDLVNCLQIFITYKDFFWLVVLALVLKWIFIMSAIYGELNTYDFELDYDVLHQEVRNFD